MNIMRNCCLILLAALFGLPDIADAELKLPSLFSDAMVLQRNQPVRVWGWATSGAEISVSIAAQQHKATANADGRWQLVGEWKNITNEEDNVSGLLVDFATNIRTVLPPLEYMITLKVNY